MLVKSRENFLNDNDLSEYLLKKGIRELNAKKYEESKMYFDELMIISLKKDFVISKEKYIHLFLLRGITNYHLKDYSRAASDFLKTLIKRKNESGIGLENDSDFYHLANFLESYDRSNSYIRNASDALTILLELINNPRKYKLNKKIKKEGRKNLYMIYFARAFTFKRFKKLKLALLDINRSIVNNPPLHSLPWLYTEKAFLHMQQRNYLEAIKDINEASKNEIIPFCYQSYFAMGLINIKFSNFNMAISMFDEEIGILNKYFRGTNLTSKANAFILRGYSKICYQNIEEGIDDIGLGLALDKNCSEKYKKVFQNIDEGIKNIIRIRFNLSI